MSRANEPAERRSGESDSAVQQPLISIESELLRNVQVTVEARLAEKLISLDELTALTPGSSLVFDHHLNEPIDLYVNGMLVARGEIVAVDDNFGVRIVEIAEVT